MQHVLVALHWIPGAIAPFAPLHHLHATAHSDFKGEQYVQIFATYTRINTVFT